MTTRRSAALVGVLALAALAGCGSNGDDDLDLSPLAAEGRSVMRTNGCASCHGSRGEGGVGPALAGVYGAEVELEDGTTVTADDAYLTESITDPGARRVAGYGLRMPANDLSDDEIEAVISFIRELGVDGGTAPAVELSELAAEGRSLSRSSGCSTCHLERETSETGASFAGLFGAEIELDDGTTVTADETYLTEAIADPGARNATGYGVAMPTNSLSPSEIDAIVAYIRELGGAAGSGS